MFIIMSLVTATINALPVVVACSLASPFTDCYNSYHLYGLAALGQHYVFLPLQLILKRHIRGSIGFSTVLQQQQLNFQMPSQAYVNYAMGPSHVSFLFQS